MFLSLNNVELQGRQQKTIFPGSSNLLYLTDYWCPEPQPSDNKYSFIVYHTLFPHIFSWQYSLTKLWKNFDFSFWILLKFTTKRLKESAFWRTPSDHHYLSDVWDYFYWVSSLLRFQDALRAHGLNPSLFQGTEAISPSTALSSKTCLLFDCRCLSVCQRSQSVTSLSEVLSYLFS